MVWSGRLDHSHYGGGCEGVSVVVMVVWRDESPLVNMFRNSPDGNSVVKPWCRGGETR